MIEKQMTIFDLLYPEKIDPLHEVAMNASVHWLDSKNKLIAEAMLEKDIKDFARVVRYEYCPYGLAGHYGGTGEPNTLQGWQMLSNRIEVSWYDAEGKLKTQWFSWEDFAREIYFIIVSSDMEKWRNT